MRRRCKILCSNLFFLILYIVFYINITFFTHVHFINGEYLTHSHYFKNHSSSSAEKENTSHAHSDTEIDFINHHADLSPLISGILEIAFTCNKDHINYDNDYYFIFISNSFNSFYLRAPPLTNFTLSIL